MTIAIHVRELGILMNEYFSVYNGQSTLIFEHRSTWWVPKKISFSIFINLIFIAVYVFWGKSYLKIRVSHLDHSLPTRRLRQTVIGIWSSLLSTLGRPQQSTLIPLSIVPAKYTNTKNIYCLIVFRLETKAIPNAV